MSTAGSVSHDRKSNASKSRRSTNNVGEGISSKNNKTGGDEEDTTEHKDGGALSNTTKINKNVTERG